MKKAKVEDIVDFMNMDDDVRQKILKLNEREMNKLASVCSRYPYVEMDIKTK